MSTFHHANPQTLNLETYFFNLTFFLMSQVELNHSIVKNGIRVHIIKNMSSIYKTLIHMKLVGQNTAVLEKYYIFFNVKLKIDPLSTVDVTLIVC